MQTHILQSILDSEAIYLECLRYIWYFLFVAKLLIIVSFGSKEDIVFNVKIPLQNMENVINCLMSMIDDWRFASFFLLHNLDQVHFPETC